MRFVAIFNKDQIPYTLGFASSIEALDFLFWGYEDQHLLPFGVYDRLTDQAIVYTHAGQLIHTLSEESIRTTAMRHLAMTQLSTHHQPY